MCMAHSASSLAMRMALAKKERMAALAAVEHRRPQRVQDAGDPGTKRLPLLLSSAVEETPPSRPKIQSSERGQAPQPSPARSEDPPPCGSCAASTSGAAAGPDPVQAAATSSGFWTPRWWRGLENHSSMTLEPWLVGGLRCVFLLVDQKKKNVHGFTVL